MPAESEIEAHVSAYAKSVGVLSYKFTSPANRGVPDRIYLYKGHAMFIEYKRTGKWKLDPLQVEVSKMFMDQGFIVQICNDRVEGRLMIIQFKEGVDNARPL